jgi:DNA-binding winged helix-turn-helix (wHTH) protein/predicted ATPase
MTSRRSKSEARAIRIEVEHERAWCGAERLELTPKAFAVLRYLVEHPQRLITKDDLLAAVWRDVIVSEAALTSCIRDLRQALGDSSRAPRYIETVHRRGFRFIGPIEPSGHRSQGAEPRLTSAPSTELLVGRGAELARLSRRLELAMSGQRQLVFVTGEPGIGKTALLEVFLAHLDGARAPRVARGQCVEQYGAGEAYLPVLDALGQLGRAEDGRQLVRVLRQHAPTWLVQLPGLLSDRDLEAVQRRAQAATRERMLRELVEALDAFSLETPLVLVLEDLHWSDSATIDVLAMLARRHEPARLLVLGTYRPEHAGDAAHPLKLVKQELEVHGYCDDVPVSLLTVASVEDYLARRFPGHQLPAELARVLHQNTEGNPLFLVNTIDDLIAQGHLREDEGRWTLSEAADAAAAGAPVTLRQMVERQVERLSPDEQAVLAVASVAGAEFSAAVADAGGIEAHAAEERCRALAMRGQFLRAIGASEWPDGTVAERHAFIHALYRDVLYARLPAAQRIELHRRVGERLERGHGPRASEIAGELAVHFEEGRDFERATQYHSRAGENALRQHGYREAAAHATRALQLLPAGVDPVKRARLELTLQVMLGAALTATRGYAAPEVARTYARARELCAELKDTPQLLPVLLGLGRFYVVRADFHTARDVGAHLLTMAAATQDRTLQLAAHNAVGVVSFYAGDLESALAHLERGIELYDPRQHSPDQSPAFRLGQDPGVSCTTHAALTLQLLGYPARAAARMEEALGLARSLRHPFSVAYACHFAAGFYQWRRECAAMRAVEDVALAHDTEHGFDLFLTAGAIHRGWLAAEEGRAAEGLAQMQLGLARIRAIGAAVLVPAYLALIAEVHGALKQPVDGLVAVSEALAAGRRAGQHYWESELHRLSGVLTLQTDAGGTLRLDRPGAAPEADQTTHLCAGASAAVAQNAESRFLEALAVARRQRAKWLELRAATSIGRLWAHRGRADEARALLGDICGRFTEGFDTPDLIEAKALLEELNRLAAAPSIEKPAT